MQATQYQAKTLDQHGFIAWDDEENATWAALLQRQNSLIINKACSAYLYGLQLLDLPLHRVPQLYEVDTVLQETTGWQTVPVPCLINFDKFFALLAQKKFPVATFIRSPEEFDYLQEPDIFHEIYGHCPLLTHPAFAHFTHVYGQTGLHASKEERVYLARLYWFTVEFGLLKNKEGQHQIYGGGILSSPGETQHAFSAKSAQRKDFDVADVLRTPYRIDIMQPIYYALDALDDLFELSQRDLLLLVKDAQKKALFPPLFPEKES